MFIRYVRYFGRSLIKTCKVHQYQLINGKIFYFVILCLLTIFYRTTFLLYPIWCDTSTFILAFTPITIKCSNFLMPQTTYSEFYDNEWKMYFSVAPWHQFLLFHKFPDRNQCRIVTEKDSEYTVFWYVLSVYKMNSEIHEYLRKDPYSNRIR